MIAHTHLSLISWCFLAWLRHSFSRRIQLYMLIDYLSKFSKEYLIIIFKVYIDRLVIYYPLTNAYRYQHILSNPTLFFIFETIINYIIIYALLIIFISLLILPITHLFKTLIFFTALSSLSSHFTYLLTHLVHLLIYLYSIILTSLAPNLISVLTSTTCLYLKFLTNIHSYSYSIH